MTARCSRLPESESRPADAVVEEALALWLGLARHDRTLVSDQLGVDNRGARHATTADAGTAPPPLDLDNDAAAAAPPRAGGGGPSLQRGVVRDDWLLDALLCRGSPRLRREMAHALHEVWGGDGASRRQL